ncbi:polyprenyl diphosphate synthase [Alcaligenes sp. SDU_A2]|uniref:polyprenyl diphosphate synthase n=1 Tax=Alcaligenes sp. SDU_A2 TaxID=3136634 RepID=UPI00311F4DF9
MIPFSSTQRIPPVHSQVPGHLAIVMDGNGRWATRRMLPRTAGHLRGVQAVRRVVEACGQMGVKYLTLFAFSSENWRRPADEVSMLMRLFVKMLQKEVALLQRNGVRLHVVGDLSAFSDELRQLIAQAQEQTRNNDTLHLTIAANYGGRWDILQAAQKAIAANPQLAVHPEQLNESLFSPHLAMAYAPEPDLFIRTGGERRISNFLIWQMAYTELYFTDVYWPDFGRDQLEEAFEWYRGRERRFGRTSAQVLDSSAS